MGGGGRVGGERSEGEDRGGAGDRSTNPSGGGFSGGVRNPLPCFPLAPRSGERDGVRGLGKSAVGAQRERPSPPAPLPAPRGEGWGEGPWEERRRRAARTPL